jgi:hypothetical protein
MDNLSIAFTANATPQQAFAAITKDGHGQPNPAETTAD